MERNSELYFVFYCKCEVYSIVILGLNILFHCTCCISTCSALYIDVRKHTYWHIHIDTTPNNYSFSLCNS